jgi:hypothetical protein
MDSGHGTEMVSGPVTVNPPCTPLMIVMKEKHFSCQSSEGSSLAIRRELELAMPILLEYEGATGNKKGGGKSQS